MIARQVQIDLITDTYNPIVEWFDALWSETTILETNVYHNGGGEFIYYVIMDDQKKIVFYRDDNAGDFWCDYKIYWARMSRQFNLTSIGVQNVTSVMIQKHLDEDYSIPVPIDDIEGSPIEVALRCN